MADAKKKSAKKKTAKKKTAKKKTSRKKKVEAASRGLDPAEMVAGDDNATQTLCDAIEADGGQVLARYRDPLGSNWQVLAALPLDRVEPTPFQRDLSATHAKRMTDVIDKLDRFLDPVITVRTEDGKYWTPNGLHRLTAMQNLGAKSIVALVVPQFELCYKILALNTERAHNLKEKALEVIRMARSLSELGDQHESSYALEFEEPSLLTVGLCYEEKARFSGSAYNPIIKRCEAFLDEPLTQTLPMRAERAKKVLAIDEKVAELVAALKARGFDSPYLKAFIVARINPLRSSKSKAAADFDETFASMLEKAEAFDAESVKAEDVKGSGGGGGE